MGEQRKLPFHSFSFWMIRGRRPRVSLRMTAPEEGADGLYELVVQTGSATNPTARSVRSMAMDGAERLRDAMQRAGLYDWEESYGDVAAPGSLRWAVSVVFQQDVFAISSKGGSDTPPGFDGLLEELYRLDLPRPTEEKPQAAEGVGRSIGDAMGSLGMGSIGAMSAGDLGAYAATKGAAGDHSYLMGLFKGNAGAVGQGLEALEALEGFSAEDIDTAQVERLFAQMKQNPQAMTERLREEFRHLPREERDRLLDALASTGYASRAWWERFFGL